MAQFAQIRMPPTASVREILKLYRVKAVKRLSQNFLMNEKLNSRIVKQAGKIKDSYVLEVGPGPGGITRSILQKMPKKLIVIEKDRRFEPSLEMLANAFSMTGRQMDIYFHDIMLTDMSNLFPPEAKKEWEDVTPNIQIVGNLPFSVSTALLIKWLERISEKRCAWSFGRTKMALTFQKEVAERIVAGEGGQQRCRLSLMAQAWTYPKLQFTIPGSAFVPKPKVDVGVVTFVPLIKPKTQHPFKLYEKMARHLFSFRQKISIKGAGTLFPPENRKQYSTIMYQLCNLNPSTKPTALSAEDVDRLCSAYKYLCEKHPEIELYDYRASRRIIPTSYTSDVYVEDEEEGEDEKEEGEDSIEDSRAIS